MVYFEPRENWQMYQSFPHHAILSFATMNRFPYLLLLVCGLASAVVLPAQTNIKTPAQADSLRRVIATAKHDTTRVSALNQLANYFWEKKSQYDSAMTYAQEAQKMAERSHFRKGVADALNNMGGVYRRRGKYSEALENSFASLRIHQEIGNKYGIAFSLNNIAIVYNNQGKYAEALEYHFKSLRIREEIADKSGIASSLYNIAFVYDDQGKYAEALENHFKSLRVREEIGDKGGIASSLNNIALVYYNQGKYTEALENHFKSLRIKEEIGDKSGIANSLNNIANVYINQGKDTEALEYYFKSLRIKEEIGDKSGIANSLNNIASVYDNQGKYAEALENYFKTLRIKEELGDKSGIAGSLTNIGIMYNRTGQFKQAQPYLFQSLQLSRNLGRKEVIAQTLNYIAISYRGQGRFDSALVFSLRSLTLADSLRVPVPVKEALEELSIIMDSLGRHKESLAYFQRYMTVKDSLVNLESLNKSSALKEDYEAEKREQQIALLNKDKEVLNKDKALKESELMRQTAELSRQEAELARADAERQAQEKSILVLGNEKQLRELTLQQQEAALTEGHLREERNQKALKLSATERELQRTELARRSVVQWSLAGILVVVFAAAIWLASLYRQKTRANAEILLQQRILEDQSVEIEISNTALHEKNIIIEQDRTLLAYERERSERLLLSVLPAPIAERMKAGETRIAEHFTGVTVLFADIVGFTKLSANVNAQELVELLDALFSALDALAAKHGLEKIKTIGDAYMVVCGVPVPIEDHAKRVARFALEIHSVLDAVRLRWVLEGKELGASPVRMRVGIHTGEAVAGVIGTSKFSYDLWGDTVNTASRMESHGEAGKIHVSEEVFTALKGAFTFEERGEIEVKGKGQMRTWFLAGTTALVR
jgi:class 3 adenylate cyclase